MSLRERLALKAGHDADKMPPRSNPLYDNQMNMGKGISSSGLAILKNELGQRRRRGGEGSDSEDDLDAG